MRDSPPMAEEIRNGFYPAFEAGWRRAELVGRGLMLVVVVATVFGVLGGGPLSLWTSELHAGALDVEFPPVIRFGTPTDFTLRAHPAEGQARMTVAFPADLVKAFGLQSVYPRPAEWRADQDGSLVMTFATLADGQDTVVEVGGMPVSSGRVTLSARLDGAPAVSWTQVILP
ncbi:hypothetical protein P7D22_19080 [Lichenihabitans sp. Uapishka_5]|uniref:hypothetical protein n=1 Tax=Lichenihabitans sp. Uapishka_5 TaxID=3037302 RepID=UPI0029E7D9CF|nr:hypothetical protein [Lichenihabitans sp. Uapishka_5]MDX7953270.1 hypothetical protein [Lichenihabitans sp. Uapishka_5]